MVLHQHLAVGERRGLAGDQLEVAGNGFALGAVVENDLLIGGHVVSLKWTEVQSVG